MLRKAMFAVVTLFSFTLLSGCGDQGNTVVAQPDVDQMQAKKQEFAEFQKQMSEESSLPSRPR